MTNSISEVEQYDVLFVIGSNTTEAHPIIGGKMKRAARRGAKLIVADPRHIELVDHAAMWLQLRPGTDAALINGMINVIVNERWADWEFIAKRAEGYDDLWDVVKKYTPEVVSEITGVPAEQIRAAAELYARTPRAGIFYTLGITEHTTGTANVINLANLALVTGHVGVPHAGVNPLRGQNNVQGACDMGALPNTYPDYRSVTKPEYAAIFEEAWKASLSRELGLRTPEMLDAMVAGEIKALYVMGEDPVLTDADANHVRRAIASLDFLVVQDIFLTETAKYADVVLPAACYAEKDGTFTNTERRVQRVRKAVEPPGEARADDTIIADLSTRMGYAMHYDSPADIFEEIRDADPDLRGHDVRPRRCLWPAVALPRPRPPGHAVPARGHVPAGTRKAHGRGVRGAGRARERRLPDPADHRAHALPVQHLDPAVAHPRGIGAVRADRDQSGGRAQARHRERWPDAGDFAERIGRHHGEA